MIEITKLMEGVESVPHFERYDEEELTALYAFQILQYCHEVQATRYHIQRLIDQSYDEDALSQAPILQDANPSKPLDTPGGYLSYSPHIESILGHVAKGFLGYSIQTGEIQDGIPDQVVEQSILDIRIEVGALKVITDLNSNTKRENPLNASGGIYFLNKHIREIHGFMIARIQDYLESMVTPMESWPNYPIEPIRNLLCLSANALYFWHIQLDNIQEYLEKDAKLSLQ